MRTGDAMQRHDFDPIAFTFGVLFTGSGILFMIGRFDLFNRTRWLWPGLLVLLGIAVLVGARGRGSQGRGRTVQGTATEPVLDADLDSIDPPVGPEAFRLPGWPPRAGEAEASSKTDVLEPVEREAVEPEAGPDQPEEPAPAPDSRAETEVIDTVDSEAETRPLRQPQPPEEPPASS
ncbi:MAG TPA: hypothetical protein VE776_11055 [Actinomycetota bacterium]|jgi:hypothetical protein|nr:hypothetical protein [Actinomycetota bacterium]